MALLVAGCRCDPPAEASITILSPTEGTTLTRADDTDDALDGIQIEVEALSVGLGLADEVDVLVDGMMPVSGFVDAGGNILFTGVTLPAGTHRLTAVSRGVAVTSEAVTVIVDDSCATITFVMPEDPGTGRLDLGPADDTDGEMCGTTFETTVSVATNAGDGSNVQVFVNGTPRSSERVMGTAATIYGVALGNRGDSPNTLSVTVTRPDGVECSADFPAQIFVDCAGASCDITRPDSTTAYLNQTHDVSSDPGFQGEFDVTTDADGVAQDVRFIIDGNESGALIATPMMVGMGGVATFGNVGLTEGLHRFVAECDDGLGNLTRSGAVEWTIDITPCGITIVDPDGSRTLTDDMDDTDPGTPGIQLAVDGTTAGVGCTGIRVGNCATVDTLAFAMADASWSVIADIPTDPTQELCAQVEDVAGNVGEFRLPLTVRTEAPQLQIVTPATGACFNDAGGGAMSCIADLNPPSPVCDVAFSVYCDATAGDVTLRELGLMPVLAGGTAPCAVDGAAPPPFTGRATFAMVQVPSRASLAPVAIEARQTVDGLTGTTSLSYISDCDPPLLTFRRPLCGATLRPSSQDENPTAPGFQYGVEVWNSNTPKPPVDLTITDSGGGSVYSATSMTPSAGITTQFVDADFTAGGALTMAACASDLIGNRGCNSDAPCTVTVADIPTLSITVPSGGSILSASSDCAPGTPGLQITVTANTDAAVGSPATITVGGIAAPATTVMTGGAPNRVTACVDAPDGAPVSVVVTVTDSVRGMAMATAMVTIDSRPPTTAISDFAPVLPAADRRGGEVNFTWTAVADTGGGNLTRYEARCSTLGPITSEAEWTAASVITVMVAPASSGTVQMEAITGFRLAQERWCVLRGFDVAGAASPLPPTAPASVTLQPTQVTLTAPLNGEGVSVVGVGDVNGDAIGDVLVGSSAPTLRAYVYFGSAAGPGATPNVTIEGGGTFGVVVAGVGDISGDGVPDFAVSARAGSLAGAVDSSGSVYVFFGRTSSTPWPPTIDVRGAGSCAADICLTSSVTPALFGWTVAGAGDFDGDGVGDLAVGAYRANSEAGRIFVIRGRSTWTPGSTFSLPGAMAPDGFMIEAPATVTGLGRGLTTCGDLGTDGRADLILGAGASGISRVNGRAYGAATGLVTIAGTEVSILDTGVGEIVACLGDTNGDGARDVAAFNAGGGEGGIRVYLQSAGSFSLASSRNITNDGTGAGFGRSIGLGFDAMLGAIGDLDRDSSGDLLCGSTSSGTGPGDVSLFYGGTVPAPTRRSQASASFDPPTADASGIRVAAYIGDVTGDGFPDFAIGDFQYMSNVGRVLVYY